MSLHQYRSILICHANKVYIDARFILPLRGANVLRSQIVATNALFIGVASGSTMGGSFLHGYGWLGGSFLHG